jgi:hypothetical protein
VIDEVVAYNDENDLRWLVSFLPADRRKSYCFYEAVDIDAVRWHATTSACQRTLSSKSQRWTPPCSPKAAR